MRDEGLKHLLRRFIPYCPFHQVKKVKKIKKKLDKGKICYSLSDVRLDKPLYFVQAQIRRELLGGD